MKANLHAEAVPSDTIEQELMISICAGGLALGDEWQALAGWLAAFYSCNCLLRNKGNGGLLLSNELTWLLSTD